MIEPSQKVVDEYLKSTDEKYVRDLSRRTIQWVVVAFAIVVALLICILGIVYRKDLNIYAGAGVVAAFLVMIGVSGYAMSLPYDDDIRYARQKAVENMFPGTPYESYDDLPE